MRISLTIILTFCFLSTLAQKIYIADDEVRIKDKPDNIATVIFKATKGDTIKITGYENHYWKGACKGHKGYISEVWIRNDNDSVLDSISHQYLAKIKRIQRLKKEAIKLGVSESMVREAFGNPTEIHETKIKRRVDEQWIYRYDDYTKYYYFTNGVLTGIQD